jgi:hypothetical protein
VFNKLETQRIFEYSIVDDYLLTWIEAFLIDRKARWRNLVKRNRSRFKQIWYIIRNIIRTFVLDVQSGEGGEMEKRDIILAAMSPAKGESHTPVQVQKLLFLIDRNISDKI